MPNKLRAGVLLGSLRAYSYHRVIAESLPTLVPEYIELVPLPELHLPLYDGDVEEEGIPASVAKLGEAIESVDILLIVSPEYNHSIPGVLKNAIDWISRLPSRPLTGKPVLLISGSPGPRGGGRAQEHLRLVLEMLRARILDPAVTIPAIHEKVHLGERRVLDPATLSHIRVAIAEALSRVSGAAERKG